MALPASADTPRTSARVAVTGGADAREKSGPRLEVGFTPSFAAAASTAAAAASADLPLTAALRPREISEEGERATAGSTHRIRPGQAARADAAAVSFACAPARARARGGTAR